MPTRPSCRRRTSPSSGVGRNGTNAISALLTWRSGDGATGTGVQGYEVGLSRRWRDDLVGAHVVDGTVAHR